MASLMSRSRAWCPLCVQYRAKQDLHRPSTHESSGHSVLSMDFGFCSREEDEADKLTCLFVHDRATKMMAGILTPQKGWQVPPILHHRGCALCGVDQTP